MNFIPTPAQFIILAIFTIAAIVTHFFITLRIKELEKEITAENQEFLKSLNN